MFENDHVWDLTVDSLFSQSPRVIFSWLTTSLHGRPLMAADFDKKMEFCFLGSISFQIENQGRPPFASSCCGYGLVIFSFGLEWFTREINDSYTILFSSPPLPYPVSVVWGRQLDLGALFSLVGFEIYLSFLFYFIVWPDRNRLRCFGF